MPTATRSQPLDDLLETLVNIPSETGNEAAISNWVHERLQTHGRGEIVRSGLAVVWRGPKGRGANAPGGRPLVVLVGHLDTVPANGNERARREGGRLYGVGSTDMKSGDAVALGLIETLDLMALRFDLAGVFYDAEEGPHEKNGLKRLLVEMPWLREARLAIVLEPTNLKLELGCNGAMNAEVRVTGKSAHSARPWTGVNAIGRAAEWLKEVTEFASTPVNVAGIEFVETLQVTTLRAGRTRNVIPDELVANLNYRFPPDRTVEQAEAKLRSVVPDVFEFRVVDRSPPGRVCTDSEEVREFMERFPLEVAGKQGWTDVAQFTAAGVAAFNFGPGIPELAHQVDEYCPIENLESAYTRLADFLSDPRP